MELDFAAIDTEVKLVVNNEDVLSADVGPTLALVLQISKQNLEEEIAKKIKEDGGDPAEGEQEAADELADEATTDVADATVAEGEGFFGMSPTAIEARLEADVPNMRSALTNALNTWLDDIGVNSVDAAELSKLGVTANEVPESSAEAFAAEAGEGGESVFEFIPCAIGVLATDGTVGDALCT
jgi:hypothetical protein